MESIHPHAFAAAIASECAGAQGSFKSYHDTLFENQDAIGVKSWESFAELAGALNVEEFRTCIEDEQLRDRVERDIATAQAIGASATPTFIVNGQLFSGALPLEQWEGRVEVALRGD